MGDKAQAFVAPEGRTTAIKWKLHGRKFQSNIMKIFVMLSASGIDYLGRGVASPTLKH